MGGRPGGGVGAGENCVGEEEVDDGDDRRNAAASSALNATKIAVATITRSIWIFFCCCGVFVPEFLAARNVVDGADPPVQIGDLTTFNS